MKQQAQQELFEAINEIVHQEQLTYTRSSEINGEAQKVQMEFGKSTMFEVSHPTPDANRQKLQTKMSEHKHEKRMLEFNSDFDGILQVQKVQNTT